MNPWITALIGLIIGAAAVAIVALLRRGSEREKLAGAQARADLLDQQVRDLRDADARREDAERKLVQLQEQHRAKEQQFQEQKKLLEEAEQRLGDTFGSVGAKALQNNNEQFLVLAKKAFEGLMTEAKGDVEKKQQAIDQLVKPIRELLEKQNTAVGEIEKKRESAYTRLEEQFKQIIASHQKLDQETGRLVTALRRPEQRGRWGEMQLRNAVELAGMTRHCDFTEQAQTDDPSTRDRPDMIVRMPGEGVIVVDAKVALDAYLDALQPDADRDRLMKHHAEQVEAHYKRLAGKRYWDQFDRTPKLVVMFMPLESALVAALETKPHLHAEAMQQHVLVATPTLLVALLRAVAYGWQQDDVAANARKIADVGRDLYSRLSTFVDHVEKVGTSIHRAAKSYNDAVGSMERRLIPGARKLKELHATTEAELESPPPVEIEVRDISVDRIFPREDVETAIESGAEKGVPPILPESTSNK